MTSSFLLLFATILSIQFDNSFYTITHKKYENGHLSSMELIRKYGYKGEEHNITTSDGYIITAHRIVRNMNVCTNNDTKKPPVVILHGLSGTSTLFLFSGPETGLGFLLADQCYDVWLSNYRGNKYGKTHVNLTTSDPEFWDFSFHEIALYDNPAIFDYVLNNTGAKKLLLVCNSQGCTSAIITDIFMPDYTKERILATMGLSPVGYLGHTGCHGLRFTANLLKIAPNAPEIIGNAAFPPLLSLMRKVVQLLCTDEMVMIEHQFCGKIMAIIGGADYEQFNSTLLPMVFQIFPDTSSLKHSAHYGQLIRDNSFRQYDYGALQNQQRYNSSIPPDYAVEESHSPIAIWYGNNDRINPQVDIDKLAKRLPNLIGYYRVPWDNFTHFDFITGKDAKTLVYKHMFQVMAQLY